MNDAARALRALLLVAVLDGGSSFSLAPLSAGVLSRCSTGRCENAAAFKRRIAPPSRQPVMSLFPDGGGMDQDTVEGPGLVGFWALLSADMDQGPIVLRADGQIGGGPKVPGWEDPGVKWASEMRIAGGKWEQFTGEDGRSGLRLEFLVPPRGRVHRERSQLTAPELRERLLYTGTLIEMLEDDGKKQTKVLRCFGSVEHIGAPITPVEEGVAAAEVQASPAISRFSLVKTDTTQFTKLIPTVKPYSRPFGTEAREVTEERAARREEDHDPAGLHKKVKAQEERMQALQALGDILPERADQLREGVESAVEERRLRTGPISGDELAAEMAAEVKLQGQVDEEMLTILKMMEDGMPDEPPEPEGGAPAA